MKNMKQFIISFFRTGWGRTLLSLLLLISMLFIVHEAGHAVIQLFTGVPISIGTDNLLYGLSTMYGMNIFDYPAPIIFILSVAGFVATLLPIKYLKDKIFMPEFYDKFLKGTRMESNDIRMIFYLLICVMLASHDFGILLRLFLSG